MNKSLLTSNKDDWCTPQAFFDELDREFHFDLDAAASSENAKCKRYFTKETDGLKNSWGGVRYSVILRMGERLLNGYGKRQARRQTVQRLLCLLRRVLTRYFFTNTYTTSRMLKSDL